MFYTIYKTTNLINGKYYIGKHQTKNLDDGYVGSGIRLKYAIKKYSSENFVTDILFVFDEEWKMNLAEKILVVPDVETNYNLCPGGKGGFGFINERGLGVPSITKENGKEFSIRANIAKNKKYALDTPDRVVYSKKMSASLKKSFMNRPGNFTGKIHSDETRKKMQKPKNIGEKNSQHGTCWINNGSEVRKVKLDELKSWISQGYQRGRKFRK